MRKQKELITVMNMELEPFIRLSAFSGGFILFALWEVLHARRNRSIGRKHRWPGNLGITLLNTLVLRLLFSTAAVGTAAAVYGAGYGALAVYHLPYWLKIVGTVLFLDFTVYIQHVMFHTLPLLRRIHRMHHIEQELDVTTGLRFHPFEMVLSTFLKMGAVAALGAPPLGVVLFEVILNFTSMFNHSNIYFHPRVDAVLRLIVVTPDMHRVHHSVYQDERNSNYGFSIPWWDRLLGTYRAQPRGGHLEMTLGYPGFLGRRNTAFYHLLVHPFERMEKDETRGA